MMKRIIGYIFLFVLFITGIRLNAQDKTPPERAYITYVTVDTATNNSLIYWTESPSSDVEQYYLYYEIKTINGYEGVKFDSVSAGTSMYTHVNGGAGTHSILYSVTAVDSSWNESIRKPGLHSTIFNNLQYDSCQERILITWNLYQGWGTNVSGYRILRSINNSPFEVLSGVSPSDSLYYDYGITQFTGYRYLIQAVKNDGLVSTSNIASKYTVMPVSPPDLRIDYATVPSENTVDVSFAYTPNGEVSDFSLLRSSNPVSDFQEVATVNALTSPEYVFTDNIITSSEMYYYKIGAVNGCGNVIGTSGIAVNILLKGDTLGDGVRLAWNRYEEWEVGVMEYNIYREETDGTFTRLASTGPGVTTWTDRQTGISTHHLSGELTYYVEAIRNSGGIKSRSNLMTVRVSTHITFIPDAFTPNSDGKNDHFAPVFDFVPSEFLMVIYNRNGIPVFTTEDPETGWDGSINGNNMAQEGVYIYHIQYKAFTGTRLERTGHVTVFYP